MQFLSYSVVFFDFKSAYNTVDRELLYQKLLEKSILTDQEVTWMRSLHSRVTIQCGDSLLRPKNGLHQGSMISPLLFDIYAEEIIADINTKLSIEFEDILFHADDLAVICPNNKLERLITQIEDSSNRLKLILNRNKYGILPIKRNRHDNHIKDQEVKGIPVVDYYRYLGVELNSDMEISRYLQRVIRKTAFIMSRISSFTRQAVNPENRRFLWVALIRPLFDYVLPILEDQKKETINLHRTALKKTYKLCIGLRKTISDEILEPLIGDYDAYTSSRAR